MKTVLVVGAGTMGSAIAQVIAQAGYKVYLNDISLDFIQSGLRKIEKDLAKQVAKGRLAEQVKEDIQGRISPLPEVTGKEDINLVIEAIVEDADIKQQLFAKLTQVLAPGTILASNTSSLSITEIASKTPHPENFIGIHFFNPVTVMKLIEIIRGALTSDETFAKTKAFVESIGKTGVEVQEAPGFVVNRMLVPVINEAVFILAEGIASAEDVDSAMKLGANHPIGPLALGDLIGLDVCLAIMETLYQGFKDSKYRPCPLLRKMVLAGKLGRKTGEGFFKY